MARKIHVKTPVPAAPEMWLMEIAMTFKGAQLYLQAGLEAPEGFEKPEPWQLAPLFCLSVRGIRYGEAVFERAAGTAFENFMENYSPEEASALAPVLAFAFCYMGAHLGLGLVGEDEAGKVLDLADEQVDQLYEIVNRMGDFHENENPFEELLQGLEGPPRRKKKERSAAHQTARGSDKNAGRIYIFEISLMGIEPRIWRRVAVPGYYTMEQLHWVIQGVFLWDEDHLHEFEIGKIKYGHYFEDEDNFGTGDDFEDETEYRVCDLIQRKGRKFYYLYDFGDEWDHELVVKEIMEPVAGVTYPVCLAAECAAPPEDSGGALGYRYKLDVLKDPTHSDYEDVAEWMGANFDSETVDLNAVNERLRRYLASWGEGDRSSGI